LKIKLGEIYTRHSDGVVYRVKMIDGRQVVLESKDKGLLSITDIRGLEKAYSRNQSPTPQ
jgi:hypothetical protein